LSPIGHVPVACLDFVIFQKDAAVAGLRQACVSDLGVWLWGWRRRTERERLEGRLSSAAAELARSDVSAISRVVATGPEENRRWGSGGLRRGGAAVGGCRRRSGGCSRSRSRRWARRWRRRRTAARRGWRSARRSCEWRWRRARVGWLVHLPRRVSADVLGGVAQARRDGRGGRALARGPRGAQGAAAGAGRAGCARAGRARRGPVLTACAGADYRPRPASLHPTTF
jgi:hypothetical protein